VSKKRERNEKAKAEMTDVCGRGYVVGERALVESSIGLKSKGLLRAQVGYQGAGVNMFPRNYRLTLSGRQRAIEGESLYRGNPKSERRGSCESELDPRDG
jgi:hypothetical protein